MISYRVTGHALTLSEETWRAWMDNATFAETSRAVVQDAQILADHLGHKIDILSPSTSVLIDVVHPKVKP